MSCRRICRVKILETPGQGQRRTVKRLAQPLERAQLGWLMRSGVAEAEARIGDGGVHNIKRSESHGSDGTRNQPVRGAGKHRWAD